ADEGYKVCLSSLDKLKEGLENNTLRSVNHFNGWCALITPSIDLLVGVYFLLWKEKPTSYSIPVWSPLHGMSSPYPPGILQVSTSQIFELLVLFQGVGLSCTSLDLLIFRFSFELLESVV